MAHKRSHTQDRPFTCEICDKSFTQHSALSILKRGHKKKKIKCGETNISCNSCEKEFTKTIKSYEQ